jgi:hypothetical protein
MGLFQGKITKGRGLLVALASVALLSACGGDDTISPKGLSSDNPDSVPVETSEIPSGNVKTPSMEKSVDDETIVPAGTGGNVETGTTGGTTGAETPLADTNDDGATALTATIHATKMFDKRLGLVRVDWTVSGGDDLSELYIYSSGFYRAWGDAVPPDPCGKIEGDKYSSNEKRLLLVNSNGDDLNEGSEVYDQWSSYLATAQLCTEEVCNGYVPPQSRLLGVPVCRMDLKDANDSAVRSGTFYTRVLEEGAKFHLYAKTTNGVETSATTPAVDIDPVGLNVSLNVGSNNRVRVSVTATNALENISVHEKAPAATSNAATIIANMMPGLNNVTGASNDCTSDSEVLQKSGEDNYIGSCPFKDKNTIVVTAVGIGMKNRVTKVFKINIDDVKKVELKDAADHNCKDGGGSFNWPDCEGTLNLAVHVSPANYTIKDQDGNVADSGETYAGLGEVKLYSNADKNDPIRSKSLDENGNLTFTGIARNHDHYVWHAKVGGVESNTTEKIDGLEPYKASFEMVDGSWYNNGSTTRHCRLIGSEDGGLWDGITWKGKNIDHIEVSCHDRLQRENAVGTFDQNAPGGQTPENYDHCATAEQPVKASYDSQNGKIKVNIDINGKNFGWKNTCTCDFTATAYDGKTKLHWNPVSWVNECVVHSSL